MTPKEILELSEPVEAVYTDCVAQLIANICRHLGQGKELSTMEWEIKKLSELDALTKESVKIIQQSSGKSKAEIKRALAKGLQLSVKDVENVLSGAVKAGTIAGIGFTVEESQALKDVLNTLVAQADDRANLVNTVMLNSTRNRYLWAVNSTKNEEQKLIEKLMSSQNAEQLEQQLGKVQTALNKATESVLVGTESRTQALSRVVKQLAQEGITGYIDAGGHHWSPEAYMNMDIRTTIHNTAVQAQKARSEEYGVTTFQITSHSGARPLCAPYQGKFYSWDGSDGVLEDLNGNKHVYESIHATSYGQPAGIFGINCGHDPVTFVNGYSIPRYEPTQDAEQNAKEYAESQKQRQLERNVRQAKLEAIAQDAAGNKEAFAQAAQKVKQANADYKAYCKDTGRTPRNDRLQVYTSEYGGQGYDRHISGKVTYAARGYTPTIKPTTPISPITPTNVASQATQKPSFDDIFNNVKGLEDSFKKGMGKTLEKATVKEAQEVFTKYADDLVCNDPNLRSGAFFRGSSGGVYMNVAKVASGSSYEEPYEVAFHEFGHMIDWLGNNKDVWTYLSNKPVNGQRLENVIKSDYKAFKKALGVKTNAEVISVLKAENMDKKVCGNISDILEKCTNTSYPLGIGHGARYHKRNGATEREFFAEVLDSAVANEPSYKQMQRLFPNAVDMVWEMIKGVT